jgi:N-acetylglutamate synthase-like GNAT family acetyltransferase
MTAQIRPALEAEATQIKDLINLVGINPMGLDWKRFIVAVNDDGQVIACGQVKPHGDAIREMASIAVVSEYRGQGVARAIIEALLSVHPKPLYLMCLAHNGAMYEKFGFRVLAEAQTPRYFSRVKKVFDLANIFRKAGDKLLVMKLE